MHERENTVDFQLRKIAKEYPAFFSTVETALRNAYPKGRAMMTEDMRSDRLCSQRLGYCILAAVDHELRRALENAHMPDISVLGKPNESGTDYHLEIYTPYAVFMISKVQFSCAVPRRKYYRQVYLEQTFIKEAFPDEEYRPFTDDCSPLYIITHVATRTYEEPKSIRIGRISADQKRWEGDGAISIRELTGGQISMEVIEKKSAPIVPEEITAKQDRVMVKES
jgi:hypothetical protein